MDLFLHEDNQTILWQTIHLFPHWKEFYRLHEKDTDIWFRGILEKAYLTYSSFYAKRSMNVEELKMINIKVIQVMMQDILQRLQDPSTNPPSSSSTSASISSSTSSPKIQSNNIYEHAFKKQPPKQIDFSEKATTQRTSNLSELVTQQLAMRKTELDEFHPSPNETPKFASFEL